MIRFWSHSRSRVDWAIVPSKQLAGRARLSYIRERRGCAVSSDGDELGEQSCQASIRHASSISCSLSLSLSNREAVIAYLSIYLSYSFVYATRHKLAPKRVVPASLPVAAVAMMANARVAGLLAMLVTITAQPLGYNFRDVSRLRAHILNQGSKIDSIVPPPQDVDGVGLPVKMQIRVQDHKRRYADGHNATASLAAHEVEGLAACLERNRIWCAALPALQS